MINHLRGETLQLDTKYQNILRQHPLNVSLELLCRMVCKAVWRFRNDLTDLFNLIIFSLNSGMTCQNCLPVCRIFPATFTLHLALISLVNFYGLFFAYFGFSLILKGFNIGHTMPIAHAVVWVGSRFRFLHFGSLPRVAGTIFINILLAGIICNELPEENLI